MKTKFGLNMKQLKGVAGSALFAVATSSKMAFSATTGDLNSALNAGNTFIGTIGTTLNAIACLAGAYLVFNGIMLWKKSSSDHGQQVEFKSVAVPIVAGSCLVGFTTFVMLTSQTFGFSSTFAPAAAVTGL
ncbi:DUF6750 family protein [Ferrovum sp.]|uniref:DUF6750 family protein n=1 Tax=Ferrovum sp. TaxID=2609467 RepID=UPI00262BDADE|nr:DUF6750 family protein [Ferrovum sp.]